MQKQTVHDRILEILSENPVNGVICNSYTLDKMGIMKSSTYSLIKQGKTNPTLNTLLPFANHFQVNLRWLQSGEGEKYKPEAVIESSEKATLLNKAYEEIRNLREQLKAKDEQIARLIDIIGGQTEKNRASQSPTREII